MATQGERETGRGGGHDERRVLSIGRYFGSAPERKRVAIKKRRRRARAVAFSSPGRRIERANVLSRAPLSPPVSPTPAPEASRPPKKSKGRSAGRESEFKTSATN